MAGVGTLVDLLLFYTLERLLFNRMVKQMNKNPQQVKMAMALWLMLEEIGCYDLTRKINSFDDWTIESMFDEALECLKCIQPNMVHPSGPTKDYDDAPVFVNLFDEPMNRRFFYYNREFLYTRFMHIMDTVCSKIFGENAAIEVDERCTRPVGGPFSEGTSAQGVALGSDGVVLGGSTSTSEGRRRSTLNPNASEFVPGRSSDDVRTMFLTFSKGFPLSREEIINFFISKWGDVVQEVLVEEAAASGEAAAAAAAAPPLYGRIIFKTHSIIPFILNGQSKAKFVVSGKHLWARTYVPRRR